MRIEDAREIAAPAALVWRVIVDLGRYPEWNPFVVACESDLAEGSPIALRVRGLVPWTLAQREEILEHEPGRRLCYGLRGAFLGGLASTRCHEVSEADARRARYVSRFELGGPLAPLVEALFGRRLARGFAAMTDALVRRVEALAATGEC